MHEGRPDTGRGYTEADLQRLVHELQVHQIEMEMQNEELRCAQEATDAALEKYTDLYEFAPMGYFSTDESGVIFEMNLTATALLGVERSHLLNQPLVRHVSPESRPVFLAFLKHVFAGTGDPSCEVRMLRASGTGFWANLRAAPPVSLPGGRNGCRVVFEDITSRKETEEVRLRMAALDVQNWALEEEIARRQAVEESLRQSKQDQSLLLAQSHNMQEQLRHLSLHILRAQEEERKRVSRELHDVITQTLTGINLQLAVLKKEAGLNTKGLSRCIARTQRLVEQSVDVVHRFVRELRPPTLDDLGLIAALHAFLKGFQQETGILVSLSSVAELEQHMEDVQRTVLYRVAQEAFTNVARHAHASRAEVMLSKLDDAIGMAITDNGEGFRPERLLAGKTNRHLGLIGIRERLEEVGGKFTVTSAPGQGTTLQVRIPLPPPPHAFRAGAPIKPADSTPRLL